MCFTAVIIENCNEERIRLFQEKKERVEQRLQKRGIILRYGYSPKDIRLIALATGLIANFGEASAVFEDGDVVNASTEDFEKKDKCIDGTILEYDFQNNSLRLGISSTFPLREFMFHLEEFLHGKLSYITTPSPDLMHTSKKIYEKYGTFFYSNYYLYIYINEGPFIIIEQCQGINEVVNIICDSLNENAFYLSPYIKILQTIKDQKDEIEAFEKLTDLVQRINILFIQTQNELSEISLHEFQEYQRD